MSQISHTAHRILPLYHQVLVEPQSKSLIELIVVITETQQPKYFRDRGQAARCRVEAEDKLAAEATAVYHHE